MTARKGRAANVHVSRNPMQATQNFNHHDASKSPRRSARFGKPPKRYRDDDFGGCAHVQDQELNKISVDGIDVAYISPTDVLTAKEKPCQQMKH
ncbi:hypothetical protein Ae201684P_015830 [Aphanomyces euteiches]|uniref:Uncharacterized protein n=1 Tax=Aphanomyces euteiches TaxID=100861 RepID=A0A6G0W9W5_9STRA|nr:hypothetical protein Ae201684_017142 [Aphanomyces euteiches]KAH9073930.1 hypothetical protein Ae201684P_015830 [Aphanomyces euteiches]